MAISQALQQKAEQGTSSAAFFTSTAMTVTAGNGLVACMCTNANTTLTATDSKSDAYTPAVTNSQIGVTTGIAVAPIIAGGSTTFTVTPGVNGFSSICVTEHSGMATTSPGEATNSGQATSANINPGAVNPATANDLYVACWAHGGGTLTFTFNVSGEGWTQRSNLTNSVNEPLGSQDLVASGSKTGSATLSGSATHCECVATFKAAVSTQVPYQPQTLRAPVMAQ